MASSSTVWALNFSLKLLHRPPPSFLFSHRRLLSLPTTAPVFLSSRSIASAGSPSAASVLCCSVSGVEGGGVSDTRNSEFSREFAVIANMLMRIEPLDSSDISQGVSDSAKDSMKQAISSMFGLLPSDQFDVSVRVSAISLRHLLASSIITGYTLWNAEYRISLTSNYELSFDHVEPPNSLEVSTFFNGNSMESHGRDNKLHVDDQVVQGSDKSDDSDILKGLSPEALSYIQRLEEELNSTRKELEAQKQERRRMEFNKPNDNDLLEYLRSLETEMVSELRRPSSLEVKEVIHKLVQSMLQRSFKGMPPQVMESRGTRNMEDHPDGETITSSRDYLAKLLFWCMLLGHHLRGLENRLHLSCVVGLL